MQNEPHCMNSFIRLGCIAPDSHFPTLVVFLVLAPRPHHRLKQSPPTRQPVAPNGAIRAVARLGGPRPQPSRSSSRAPLPVTRLRYVTLHHSCYRRHRLLKLDSEKCRPHANKFHLRYYCYSVHTKLWKNLFFI